MENAEPFAKSERVYYFNPLRVFSAWLIVFFARFFIGIETIVFRKIGKEPAHCGRLVGSENVALCRRPRLIFLLPITRGFIWDCWSSCLRKSFPEIGLSVSAPLSDAPWREIDSIG